MKTLFALLMVGAFSFTTGLVVSQFEVVQKSSIFTKMINFCKKCPDLKPLFIKEKAVEIKDEKKVDPIPEAK